MREIDEDLKEIMNTGGAIRESDLHTINRNHFCYGCKNYFVASVGVFGAHYLCDKGHETMLRTECEDFEDAEIKHNS